MRKNILLVLITILAQQLMFAQSPDFRFYFKIQNKEDIKRVTTLVSIEKFRNDTVWAVLPYKNKEILNQLGYEYHQYAEKLSERSAASTTNSLQSLLNWNVYPTHGLYLQYMEYIANKYPNLCKLVTIGQSVNNRDIKCLMISDNANTDEDEPAFLYTSTMHGDETGGYLLMLRYIEYLLENYEKDPDITKLINNTETWINPLSNPDGTYRDNDNTVSGASRFNANGTDLNRNFPDHIKGNHPDGDTWQKETVAMMNFMQEHKFVLSANIHSGAEVANYPLDGTATEHYENNWFVHVCKEYADTVFKHSSGGYFTDIQQSGYTNGYSWYALYGGRQDYATINLKGKEITLELDRVKLSKNSYLTSLWDYNYRSLLNYHKIMLQAIEGKVIDTYTKQPVADIAYTLSRKDNSTEYKTNSKGEIFTITDQSNYKLTVEKDGYFPAVVKDIDHQYGNKTDLGDIYLKKIQVLNYKKEPATTFNIVTEENKAVAFTAKPMHVDNKAMSLKISECSAAGKIEQSGTSTLIFRPSKGYVGSTTINVTFQQTDNPEIHETIAVNVKVTTENVIKALTTDGDEKDTYNLNTENTKQVSFKANIIHVYNKEIEIKSIEDSEAGTITYEKSDYYTFTFTPKKGYTGNDNIEIMFNEKEDNSITKTINVNVTVSEEKTNPISDINNETITCSIDPNPAKTHININTNNPFNSIQIISITGVVMKDISTGNCTSKTINISDLKPGIYIIKLKTDMNFITKQFVKQ
jgi:hypothetical protein